MKNNWPRALPYLAKTDTEPWKQLAVDDLQVPSGPDEQVALAERWMQLADTLSADFQKENVQTRFIIGIGGPCRN